MSEIVSSAVCSEQIVGNSEVETFAVFSQLVMGRAGSLPAAEVAPAMEVLNDLKQPRELVKGEPLLKLFG